MDPKELPKKNSDTNGKAKPANEKTSKTQVLNSAFEAIEKEILLIRSKLEKSDDSDETISRIRKYSDRNIWNPTIDAPTAFKKNASAPIPEKNLNQPSIICFTGGPCGGKTSAIAHVTQVLKQRGYQVFSVPEAASMIFSSGATILLEKYNSKMKIKFQYYLLLLQMMLEDIFFKIATTTGSNKIVILCDRGLMDGSAYLGSELWSQLLSEYDINENKIRDTRYGLVIHLTTAADGAEGFYTTENNQARSEGLKEAIDLDRKLMAAWQRHPNYVSLSNKGTKSFQEKLDSVINAVFRFLGIPLSTTFLKKYLVANPYQHLTRILVQKEKINVETFEITDFIFFEEKSNEYTYYRSQVGLKEKREQLHLLEVREVA